MIPQVLVARTDETAEPKTFQWKRVLFGDKPSPDLAGYCVKLLAEMNQELPVAHKVLKERTYGDDVSHSEESSEEARRAIAEIDEVLRKGAFNINVWHSNHPEVDRDPCERQVDVLGLKWDKDKYRAEGASSTVCGDGKVRAGTSVDNVRHHRLVGPDYDEVSNISASYMGTRLRLGRATVSGRDR